MRRVDWKESNEENAQILSFICPGCNSQHEVNVGPDKQPAWDWNGSYDKPTFQPSVKVEGYSYETESDYVCHFFVTEGKVRFLKDSTHEMAGQEVDLPFLR